MHKLSTSGIFLGLCLFASSLLAGPEGHFRGDHNNVPISADLELLETTLVGILVIGDDRYLINASRDGAVYSGEARAMSNGAQSSLHIKAEERSIFVQLDERQLTLRNTRK